MRRWVRLFVVGTAVLVPVVVAYASVDMSVVPSSLVFGSQCTHSTATTKPLVVTNKGTSSATNLTVSVSPSQMASVFPLGGQTATTDLGPGNPMQVRVGFSPAHVGPNNATAVVTFTDPNPSPSPTHHGGPTPTPTPTTSSIDVPLSGSAIDRFIDVFPPDLNFGSIHVGKPGPSRTLTIFDDGRSPLTIQSVFLGGRQPGDFSVGTLSSNVVTDGHPVTLTLGFHPHGVGARAAQLEINSNSCSGGSFTVQLGGVAIEQDITVSPKTIDFGTAVQGTKPTRVVSVINQGGAPLTLKSIQMVSDDPTTQDVKSFTLQGVPTTLPMIVAPGQAVVLTIRYDASQEAQKKADIKVGSNDPDTPTLTIPITATAAAATPTPSASQSAIAAPPPSKPAGSGFHLHLGAYVPTILMALAVAGFFGLLVITRRKRGIPE